MFHVSVGSSAARTTFGPTGIKQFGVPLETLRKRNQGEPVPLVLRTCAEYLEQNGKHNEPAIATGNQQLLYIASWNRNWQPGLVYLH